MMNLRPYTLLLLLLSVTAVCYGQRMQEHEPDSLTVRAEQRNQQFYDSLASKSSRRAVPRLLHRLLVKHTDLEVEKVVDETRIYLPYKGKRIAEINIAPQDVYDSTDTRWWPRLARATHWRSRHRTVRRDLLMHVGDELNPETVVRNKQLIRSRDYIYEADIIVTPMPDDTASVRVDIVTRDSYTLSADGYVHWGGRTAIELYEANLLGYGNRLSFETSFHWRKGGYGGNRVSYEVPNILGTFVRGEFIAGKSFNRSDLGGSLRKEFILPTDYELGLMYNKTHEPMYLLFYDSTYSVRYRDMDFWAGKSFELPRIKSSIYMMFRYNDRHYGERPAVGADLNSFFHDSRLMLFQTGFYREKFYTANMVYGYGSKEYVASGYRAGLTAGWQKGEFWDAWYMGMEAAVGGFLPMGHLAGEMSIGSFYRPGDDKLWRSMLAVKIAFFTPLLKSGRSSIRQFANLDYMRGWNRGEGCGAVIAMTPESGPRGFKQYEVGTNRLVLNTETVWFTPWQPLGFRVALFGYFDMGLLGTEKEMFRNRFFSTLGVGIRIKNERLIFSTIQLRFGIAFGHGGILKNQWIAVTNRQRMDLIRFIPEKPVVDDYR